MIVQLIVVGGVMFIIGGIVGWRASRKITTSLVKRLYSASILALQKLEKECMLRVLEVETAYKIRILEIETAFKLKAKDRIKAKIQEILDIDTAQISIWQLIDAPNKGAVHARGKSKLMGQFKELEEKKIQVFRDILADGFDLTIRVSEDGQTVDKKISDMRVKSKDVAKKVIAGTARSMGIEIIG